MFSDRAPERPTGLRVRGARLQRTMSDPRRIRGNGGPTPVDPLRLQTEAPAHLARCTTPGDSYTVEEECGGPCPAHRVDGRRGPPVGAVDEKGRRASLTYTVIGIGHGDDDGEISLATTRDERCVTIENPVLTHTGGARPDRVGVGPRVGLGHGEA